MKRFVLSYIAIIMPNLWGLHENKADFLVFSYIIHINFIFYLIFECSPFPGVFAACKEKRL